MMSASPAGLVSWKEKVGYAVGDTASCLYWQTFSMFLMIFYTDTFGLAPAAVGTMFLISRFLGCRHRPGDGRDRRPHEHPLGQVPPVDPVGHAVRS